MGRLPRFRVIVVHARDYDSVPAPVEPRARPAADHAWASRAEAESAACAVVRALRELGHEARPLDRPSGVTGQPEAVAALERDRLERVFSMCGFLDGGVAPGPRLPGFERPGDDPLAMTGRL